VSCSDVVAAGSKVDVYIESDANVDEVLLNMGLPRPDNIPVPCSKNCGAREEEREQCYRRELHEKTAESSRNDSGDWEPSARRLLR